MPADVVEGFRGETPMARPGQPTEVAAAFVFLASDAASYITSKRIGVAGGMAMP